MHVMCHVSGVKVTSNMTPDTVQYAPMLMAIQALSFISTPNFGAGTSFPHSQFQVGHTIICWENSLDGK